MAGKQSAETTRPAHIPWRPKGKARKIAGLIAHAAGGFLIVYLPSYFLPRYTINAAVALLVAAVVVGIAKEVVDYYRQGSPGNVPDVIAWLAGGGLGLLAAALERGW